MIGQILLIANKILKLYKADVLWLCKNVDLLVGQAVYSAKLLEKVKKNSNSKDDQEHVGSIYISNNPEQFKIIGLEPPFKLTKLKYRFSVDEEDDYKFMKFIYKNLWKKTNPRKCFEFIRKKSSSRSINKSSRLRNK